ncbi:MAG: hypothetical protein RLN69_13960, partial [Woeseiaceae bacterium]
DGHIEFREFCYYRILSSQLAQAMSPGSRTRKRASKSEIRSSATQLIRILANQGNDDPGAAERAYRAGIAAFGSWADEITAKTGQLLTVGDLDRSLDTLAALNSKGRQRLLEAVGRCISQDGRLSLAEAELLRAVCATLDCPLPPLLAAIEADNAAQ